MGHWEYDGKEFTNKDDMWEYLRDYTEMDDGFYDWVDSNYNASTVIKDLEEAIRDPRAAERRWFDYFDEFHDELWTEAGEPIEGKDFEIDDYVFEWIDDEIVEDEEEVSYNRKSQARKNSPRKAAKKAPAKFKGVKR